MRLLIIIFSISLLFSSNITTTKKKISQTKYIISKMNQKLDNLAKDIQEKEEYIKQLSSQIKNLNSQINQLQLSLKNSNITLTELNDLKKGYELKSKNIQNEITNFISENYFLNLMPSDNINDLINKEISQKILKKYSNQIKELIKQNREISIQIEKINTSIQQILKKQQELKKKKEKLATLIKNQQKELSYLKEKKKRYKEKLQALIKKQEKLQKKLVNLKIIKKRKVNVKKVGSAYFRPKIAHYRGPKTIAPLKGKIIKKFGSYIDPIYKIRVYNDSITIKPYKKNSVVRAILSGRVVYIGENNDKKIIVIKHKNNLFSIYANLDKVSPLLRKGSYVKRGQIIARVKDSLEFEVTYKDRPINPTKIISIK